MVNVYYIFGEDLFRWKINNEVYQKFILALNFDQFKNKWVYTSTKIRWLHFNSLNHPTSHHLQNQPNKLSNKTSLLRSLTIKALAQLVSLALILDGKHFIQLYKGQLLHGIWVGKRYHLFNFVHTNSSSLSTQFLTTTSTLD